MDPSPSPQTPDDAFFSPSGSSLLCRQVSEVSVCDSEDEECDPPLSHQQFIPSPLIPLKKQLELDKEDESLRRWKEQLLGSVHYDQNEERVEPEVEMISLSILARDRAELSIPLPLPSTKGAIAFSLKGGSCYNLKFTFLVKHNIVSGLTYINTVWKGGVQVDQTRVMLGTFSPQKEPYMHVMDEDVTPFGVVARGVYRAQTKFVDDDGRCYLEAEYLFEIRKDW